MVKLRVAILPRPTHALRSPYASRSATDDEDESSPSPKRS